MRTLISSISIPTNSEWEFRQACHPSMTEDCPSIPRLQTIARNQGTLNELVHKNTCAYCQRTVAIFRDMLALPPWPRVLFEAAQRTVARVKEITAQKFDPVARNAPPVFAGGQLRQGTPAEFRCFDAFVLGEDLNSQPLPVELRKLDFIEQRDLWVILRLQEPVKNLKNDCHLELMVMSDTQSFGPFTLPDLAAGHEAEIMMQLPTPLAVSWEEQMKASADLPFQFVFSICG